ncbi:MAG: Fur family transcriptional regulator [Fimbriimonadaceae bacterium]
MKTRIEPDHTPWCNVSSEADAAEFESRALSQLRDSGLRITAPRVQVIRVLAVTRRALSAYAIHERIAQAGGQVDVVSVYRTLTRLEEAGLVHRLGSVDGYYACRSADGHQHTDTAHLICTACGCVSEVTVPQAPRDAIAGQAASAGFSVRQVKVEVIGVCGHCQTEPPA